MNTTTNNWKLGLFVVTAFLVAAVALAWLGASRFERDSMQFHAYFDESVHGLSIGSPVTFRGMEIGRVDSIHAAADKKHIEVQAKLFVDKMEELGLDPDAVRETGPPRGLAVQLNSSALTQVAWVEADFIDGGIDPKQLPFEVPFLTMRTVPSTFKSVEAGVLGTLAELPTTLQGIQRLLVTVDREIGEMKLAELTTEAQQVLASLQAQLDLLQQHDVMRHLDAGVEEVRGAASSLSALMREWQAPDGPIHALADRLRLLSDNVDRELVAMQAGATGASVRRAADAVAGAADGASGLEDAVRLELAALHRALAAVERFAGALERDPAALLYGRNSTGTPVPHDR